MNLNRQLFQLVLSILFTLLSFSSSFSSETGGDIPDIRENGWIYPVENYQSHEDCKQFLQYSGHVGVDLCRPIGTKVTAIADGCVEDYSSDLSYYGSWSGAKGGATLLKHETEKGIIFYAVYGHSTPDDNYLNDKRCDSTNSFKIKKGDQIASVHKYIGEDGKEKSHLHFGIHPNSVGLDDNKFRGNNCASTDNCGWVDPFNNFLAIYKPAYFRIMSAPIQNGTIYWQTKDLEDISCEHAVTWRVTNKYINESFMTDSSYCPKACYESALDLNKLLDFFIRPTYAVNNICASEVPGNPPLVAGPVNSPGFPKEPGPVATTGPRVDLVPDFDVFSDREKHNEISANCNNSESCWATTVDPGQTVFLRLEAQVHNANADKYKRKDSKTIEGPIWWRIEGSADGWQLIANSKDQEFDIKDLDDCGNKCEQKQEETTEWTIPNYPGAILDLKAAVDGDDEIEEEGEGGDHDIDNPDKDCITNNCSRIERFYIRPPAPPPHNDDSTGTTGNSGCSETGSTLPTCESNAAAIIPIITDLLLADPELTINIKGKGIVTSTPAGIKCPGACIKDFNDQKVILTAKPKKGHVFVGWSDGCSPGKRKNVCQLDVTEDKAITATFKKK